MGIAREDIIPAVGSVPEIRIVTMKNGGVVIMQEGKSIALHAYQAAEIAGFLWPAGSAPNFEEGRGDQAKGRMQ